MTEERLAQWTRFAETDADDAPLAVEAVKELLAEVRRLQAENERLRIVSEGFMDIAGAALSRGRVTK